MPPRVLSNEWSTLRRIAVVLLAADLVFILLHMLRTYTSALGSGHFSLEMDGGYPEIYQYFKLFWIAACLATTLVRTRIWTLAGWALLFLFLLYDDFAQFHETSGFAISQQQQWQGVAGLRADDLGELAVAAVVGAAVLAFAAFAIWRGQQSSRRMARDLLCLVGLLAIFGVCVDMLHVVAYFRFPALSAELAIVEDGGEMMVMSLIALYAYDVLAGEGEPRISVWGWAAAKMRRRQSNT